LLSRFIAGTPCWEWIEISGFRSFHHHINPSSFGELLAADAARVCPGPRSTP
jgi:hypothetical protein